MNFSVTDGGLSPALSVNNSNELSTDFSRDTIKDRIIKVKPETCSGILTPPSPQEMSKPNLSLKVEKSNVNDINNINDQINNIKSTPLSLKPQIKKTSHRRKPKCTYRPELETSLDLSMFNSTDYKFDQLSKSNISKDDLGYLHYILKNSRKLIIITGAGISVASGIPDFRSSTGLFTKLKSDLNLKKTSGKDLFDCNVYRDTNMTGKFHTMMRDLYHLCETVKPTNFHKYMSEVVTEDRLLRLYTQNIDCLETSLPGLQTTVPLRQSQPWPKTVQLHGSISHMICSKCGWLAPMNPDLFIHDEAPDCPECTELENVRGIVGKRLQGIGRLRPRIVLYNELHPDSELIGKISSTDLHSRPDGLVVVGTTLKIPGVKRLVRELSHAVHAAKGGVIWLNVEEPRINKKEFENCFDLIVKGDCQLIPQLLDDYEVDKQIRDKSAKAEKRKLQALERKRLKELTKNNINDNKKQTLINCKDKQNINIPIPIQDTNIPIISKPVLPSKHATISTLTKIHQCKSNKAKVSKQSIHTHGGLVVGNKRIRYPKVKKPVSEKPVLTNS